MPTPEDLLTFAAYAIVVTLLLTFAAQPLLGILQQEGYDERAMLKWYFRRGNELWRRYALLALCALLLSALFALVFAFAGTGYAVLAGHIALAGMIALFLFSLRTALKVPLERTARIVRLCVVFYVLCAAFFYGLEAALWFLAKAADHPLAAALLRAAIPAVMPLFTVFAVALAGLVAKGYEIPHNKMYIRRATEKLSACSCIKVGITGSFGKTTVKHFAAHILGEKYRVGMTPASYNTPIGIARCVNDGGLDCDVFLAEMGARKTGDIKELCAMVAPTFGVVTGICAQHLETFGSVEAIAAEKGILAKTARFVVLGETANVPAEGALVAGKDFGAENIVLSDRGTEFDLVLPDARIHAQCALLGRHAAEDIALAAALCFLLGMTAEEIAARISTLEAVPHRLQRIEENGVTVLDDAYNSNMLGARNAIEALKCFAGKKYVVTPGLVELGELEEAANAELGAELVGLEVILVGETRILSARHGYLAAGGQEEKLRIVPDLAHAQKILSEELSAGDAVLFLNDLRDKYKG